MEVCTSLKTSVDFVTSTASTRIWRTFKEAGRPFPTVSEDDVTDFMVTEAVSIRVALEDEKARKDAEKEQWKKDTKDLDKHRR